MKRRLRDCFDRSCTEIYGNVRNIRRYFAKLIILEKVWGKLLKATSWNPQMWKYDKRVYYFSNG